MSDEKESELCFKCNGSGEGYTDGSTCYDCKGSGVEELEGGELC